MCCNYYYALPSYFYGHKTVLIQSSIKHPSGPKSSQRNTTSCSWIHYTRSCVSWPSGDIEAADSWERKFITGLLLVRCGWITKNANPLLSMCFSYKCFNHNIKLNSCPYIANNVHVTIKLRMYNASNRKLPIHQLKTLHFKFDECTNRTLTFWCNKLRNCQLALFVAGNWCDIVVKWLFI
jgi:hypothetical protein